jgi:hypothetical protein
MSRIEVPLKPFLEKRSMATASSFSGVVLKVVGIFALFLDIGLVLAKISAATSLSIGSAELSSYSAPAGIPLCNALRLREQAPGFVTPNPLASAESAPFFSAPRHDADQSIDILAFLAEKCNAESEVSSSRLYKNAEGAGFPFQVESEG